MHIGPYTVECLETGEFALDGGAMFGIVPRPLWEKKIPVDARNRIDMRLRCVLLRGTVRGQPKNILIDTGMGTKWSAKSGEIYRLDHSRYELVGQLAARGLTPDDITDVILTHLHFDHAGGATQWDGTGTPRPTFPRATYYVQQQHLAWAHQPTEKDRGSFIPADFEPLLAAKQLTTIDGPIELFPGIRMRLTHGHTTALQMPVISDGVTTVCFCADLIPTSLHVHVPWVMAYDIRPLGTIAEKQSLLAIASAEQWTLVFEHCPLRATSQVISTEKGYALRSPA